jgi:hypothetical protein
LAAKTKDVVQRLELLLVHWTRQIKEVVNNQHTSETTENSGPLVKKFILNLIAISGRDSILEIAM